MGKGNRSVEDKEEAKWDKAFEVTKTTGSISKDLKVDVVVEKTAQPRIIAIAAKNRKGRVMLAECEERGILFDTVIDADLEKNPLKTVQDIIKSEADKGNKYDVAYLSISNTDVNKNPEYSKISGTIKYKFFTSVNLYFDGHEDQAISSKAAKYKIE